MKQKAPRGGDYEMANVVATSQSSESVEQEEQERLNLEAASDEIQMTSIQNGSARKPNASS